MCIYRVLCQNKCYKTILSFKWLIEDKDRIQKHSYRYYVLVKNWFTFVTFFVGFYIIPIICSNCQSQEITKFALKNLIMLLNIYNSQKLVTTMKRTNIIFYNYCTGFDIFILVSIQILMSKNDFFLANSTIFIVFCKNSSLKQTESC